MSCFFFFLMCSLLSHCETQIMYLSPIVGGWKRVLILHIHLTDMCNVFPAAASKALNSHPTRQSLLAPVPPCRCLLLPAGTARTLRARIEPGYVMDQLCKGCVESMDSFVHQSSAVLNCACQEISAVFAQV